MKFLALERETAGASDEQFEPFLKAEAARAWELHQSGVIRELYFRGDRDEAVLMLECGSASEAQDILGTLPLVKEGLISFEVVPLKAYPGFERLFSH